jgi:hypothetical protein
MRVLLSVLFAVLAASSANASIIEIEYIGTYSGTVTTGAPAISQLTTVQIDSTPSLSGSAMAPFPHPAHR